MLIFKSIIMTDDLTEDKTFKKSVLLVSTFAAFLVPFLSSAVNLALPSIGKDLHANAISLGWVISSFLLSSAIFLMPFGRLGDIFGRKKIFSLGILLFTISTFLILFSHSILSLLVLPCAPPIGGLLTQYLGWRSIFAFLVPFGVISLILIQRRIKVEWAEAVGERFDWRGSLIYGIEMASFMWGFSRLPSSLGWICIMIGVLMAFVFLNFENRISNPVFDVRLILRNRVFAFSGIAALINYSATSAIGFFISLYLQYLKGLDARIPGLVMISQPIAMMLLSPVAGKLSDKRNPGFIASIGMGITASGLILLCFITEATPNYIIVLLLLLMGIGFGLFSSPNSNAIMSSVEKRHLGVASGVVGTMRMVGQMMSMGIAMMLIS